MSRYLACFGIALVMFALIVWGFDVLARVQIRGQSIASALSETAHYSFMQPVGTLVSFAPFAAIAWICGSLAKSSPVGAFGLMAACFLVFAVVYYSGNSQSQQHMLQREWTAATLAVGLIPFKSASVVLVALVLRFVLGRQSVTTTA